MNFNKHVNKVFVQFDFRCCEVYGINDYAQKPQ